MRLEELVNYFVFARPPRNCRASGWYSGQDVQSEVEIKEGVLYLDGDPIASKYDVPWLDKSIIFLTPCTSYEHRFLFIDFYHVSRDEAIIVEAPFPVLTPAHLRLAADLLLADLLTEYRKDVNSLRAQRGYSVYCLDLGVEDYMITRWLCGTNIEGLPELHVNLIEDELDLTMALYEGKQAGFEAVVRFDYSKTVAEVRAAMKPFVGSKSLTRYGRWFTVSRHDATKMLLSHLIEGYRLIADYTPRPPLEWIDDTGTAQDCRFYRGGALGGFGHSDLPGQ